MKESALVRKIMDAVKKAYPRAYVRKLSDRFNRGIPDILIVFRRWVKCEILTTGVLFVEAKTPTGKVSLVQAIEHEEILDVGTVGCMAMIARSVEEVLETLVIMEAIQ